MGLDGDRALAHFLDIVKKGPLTIGFRVMVAHRFGTIVAWIHLNNYQILQKNHPKKIELTALTGLRKCKFGFFIPN